MPVKQQILQEYITFENILKYDFFYCNNSQHYCFDDFFLLNKIKCSVCTYRKGGFVSYGYIQCIVLTEYVDVHMNCLSHSNTQTVQNVP